jgi:hypothetical protein
MCQFGNLKMGFGLQFSVGGMSSMFQVDEVVFRALSVLYPCFIRAVSSVGSRVSGSGFWFQVTGSMFKVAGSKFQVTSFR